MLRIESREVGPYAVNTILVWCEQTLEAVLFDPGAEAYRVLARMDELGLTLTKLVNTHGHMDHIGENVVVKDERKVPLLIHELDRPKLTDPNLNLSAQVGAPMVSPDADGTIADGEELTIGKDSLKAIHVPGHSPGSLAFFGSGYLISGDALFCLGIGRTDFPDSNTEDLYNSIQQKLYTLPEETVVYPGHGPTTTIGQERSSNPFVRA